MPQSPYRPQLPPPPVPPLNREPVISEGPSPADLEGWNQYSEDQFNESPGLRALRGLGRDGFSMPSMPDIPFASADLQPPASRSSVGGGADPGAPGQASRWGNIELQPQPDKFTSQAYLPYSPEQQELPQMSGMSRFPSPSPSQAMSSLRNAGQSYSPGFDSSRNDPNSQRYQIQQQLAGETEDRIIGNQRAAASFGPGMETDIQGLGADNYTGEANALKNFLGLTERDITANPITKGIGEAEDFRTKTRGAIMGGFKGSDVYRSGPTSFMGRPGGEGAPSPLDQQAQYGRDFDTAKMNIPLEQEKIQAASQQGVAGINAKSQLDVAKQYGVNQAEQNAFNEKMFGQGGAGGQTVAGITNPGRFGGGGVRFAPQTQNNPLLRDLTTAASNLEAAKQGLPDTNLEVSQVQYEAALGKVFGTDPSPDRVKDVAVQLLTDPELQGMDMEQALTTLYETSFEDDGVTPFTPLNEFDKSILRNLLYKGGSVR